MPRPVSNPPNPWSSVHVEWLGEPPSAELEVFEERPKSLLTRNESPDVPFRWGINPYRGCAHACAYCYARPTHQYLGWGAGTDFDRRIVVKVGAPEVLARELAAPSWRREPVTVSGNTDPYQPLEASYGLTRGCLETLLARRTPVAVITKGALVRRDVDVLAALAAGPGAAVYLSIAFADDAVARRMDPGAAAPSKRLECVRVLADAGVPVGVAVAPVIPGLNDADVPEILRRAADHGARSAFLTLLRLPAEVLPVFDERLREAFPDRAAKVRNALREMRGGRDYEATFGRRMRGHGPRWELVERLFHVTCAKLGLDPTSGVEAAARATPAERQGELFGES